MDEQTGKLYIVPTPIGNLKDITLRALEVLKEVDLIAAEDTRQTLKLLNHFEIKKPLISYYRHNEDVKSEELLSRLRQGENIALVSDAGTPGISDPGSTIILRCIEQNIDFEVLPGATAVTTALVNSGLKTTEFTFRGFLPRERKYKKEALEKYTERTETLIIYEAPHRLRETLSCMLEVLGNRKLAICRELTKLHEEIIRLTIEEAISLYTEKEPRGEYVLIVEGKSQEQIEAEKNAIWENMSIEEHIKMYINQGVSKKEAVKKVAQERKLSKSEIYKFSINI